VPPLAYPYYQGHYSPAVLLWGLAVITVAVTAATAWVIIRTLVRRARRR
jgi:hypothetical protein